VKYAVKMGSGGTIYVLYFIKIDSGIQKLIWRDSPAHRQYDLISLLSFYENRKCMLKSESRHMRCHAVGVFVNPSINF
jgi:hypothetical protein